MTMSPELQPLLGVVVAHIDANGVLLDGNAGFWRLLEPEVQGTSPRSVAHHFIQPKFAHLLQLCNAHGADEPLVYKGLLTFGDFAGKTRTLRARVTHKPWGMQLLAEFDVVELEKLNTIVLDMNRLHVQAQLDLAQTNFKLKQSAAALAQAHAQLLESEKLASVGVLAAGVAHEINNPVGFVNSNVNTLSSYVNDLLTLLDATESALNASGGLAAHPALAQLRESLDLAFLREDVSALLKESLTGLARIKDIVQALSNFAQTNGTLAWQAHDLHAGLDNTVAAIWPQVSRGCALQKAYGTLPKVMCVLPEVNQVFMHLLINAAQAVNGHGQVTLRSGCTNDEVWVEVADSGSGIAPEHLKHLFDPFFTTRAVGLGRGLGLSVVYGNVTRHHGRIEVSSTVGQGSCFRVWLPIQQPEPVT